MSSPSRVPHRSTLTRCRRSMLHRSAADAASSPMPRHRPRHRALPQADEQDARHVEGASSTPRTVRRCACGPRDDQHGALTAQRQLAGDRRRSRAPLAPRRPRSTRPQHRHPGPAPGSGQQQRGPAAARPHARSRVHSGVLACCDLACMTVAPYLHQRRRPALALRARSACVWRRALGQPALDAVRGSAATRSGASDQRLSSWLSSTGGSGGAAVTGMRPSPAVRNHRASTQQAFEWIRGRAWFARPWPG